MTQQDTLERVWEQTQARIAHAYDKDIGKIVLHSDAASFALMKFHSYSELAADARAQLEKTRASDFLDGRYSGLAFAYRNAAEQFAKMLDIILTDGGME